MFALLLLLLLLLTQDVLGVQCARGGHLDVVRALLDHGANVPMSLISSLLLQPPVTELLGTHLLLCVFWLLLYCGAVLVVQNLQLTLFPAFEWCWRHSVFGLSVCASVIKYCLWEFHQIYIFSAVWHKDELVRFLGQKVKGQFHCETTSTILTAQVMSDMGYWGRGLMQPVVPASGCAAASSHRRSDSRWLLAEFFLPISGMCGRVLMKFITVVLHIGPKLITASALDSMLSSPKVKVKIGYFSSYSSLEIWRNLDLTTFELRTFSTDSKFDECFKYFVVECEFIEKSLFYDWIHMHRLTAQTCFLSQIQPITETAVIECATQFVPSDVLHCTNKNTVQEITYRYSYLIDLNQCITLRLIQWMPVFALQNSHSMHANFDHLRDITTHCLVHMTMVTFQGHGFKVQGHREHLLKCTFSLEAYQLTICCQRPSSLCAFLKLRAVCLRVVFFFCYCEFSS